MKIPEYLNNVESAVAGGITSYFTFFGSLAYLFSSPALAFWTMGVPTGMLIIFALVREFVEISRM